MEERARYLIDANIFLETIFEQEHAEESLLFLERVANGDLEASITSLALHSIEILTVRDGLFDELDQFLKTLPSFLGLVVHQSTLEGERAAVRYAHEFGLDFEDALQYAVAKEHNLVLVSFDTDFDKTDLKRITPKEIIYKN